MISEKIRLRDLLRIDLYRNIFNARSQLFKREKEPLIWNDEEEETVHCGQRITDRFLRGLLSGAKKSISKVILRKSDIVMALDKAEGKEKDELVARMSECDIIISKLQEIIEDVTSRKEEGKHGN